MWRRPPSAVTVPGNVEARSDDSIPTVASSPAATSGPQASSSQIINSAGKDVNVGRASAEVGIIIGTLIAFGVISFLLFLLYRKRSDSTVNPLTWWQQRKAAAEPAEMNISDPMTTRAIVSEDGSTSQDPRDEKLNESQQNLVPNGPQAQPKQSIMQKIQQTLTGALEFKLKQDTPIVDVERGQSSDTLEDGASNMENIRKSGDEWSRRPISTADMSIQTKSSMALHPALARIKSKKKTHLRPGVSAFSWSTTAPTPVPPSHANLKENPLPPLPTIRDSRRDTTLTTMTEDSEPTRHRSLSSWVENMQTRKERREQKMQQAVHEDDKATTQPKLRAPAPVANPNARKPTTNDTDSVRLSDMTVDSNAKTPALQTATMAWHVHQGPGEVGVPPMPRSATREGQNQGPGLQDQTYSNYSEQNHYSHQEEQYPQQDEYAAEGGEYLQHANNEREYSQHEQEEYSQYYSQQQFQEEEAGEYAEQYEQQEQDYPEHHRYDYQEGGEQAPEIQIDSPSEATAIPEEDWIPNITRYPSATTTASGYAEGQGQGRRR